MKLINAIKIFFFVLFSSDNYRIEKTKDGKSISDGYHTFKELYEFRRLYNAAFVKASKGKLKSFKSRKHSNGDLCFGGEYFVVVTQLPTGQISNHYKNKYYNSFAAKYVPFAPKYDGHTSTDVINRLNEFIKKDVNITDAAPDVEFERG